MAQHHIIVNDTKRQYLSPHTFGDGMELLEFGSSSCATMCGLAALLAQDNNVQVRGDLHCDDPDHLVGSWAGDAIRVVGSYGQRDDEGRNAQDRALASYEDISEKVVRLLAGEEFLRRSLADSLKWHLQSLEPATLQALGVPDLRSARWSPGKANAINARPMIPLQQLEQLEQAEEQQRQRSPSELRRAAKEQQRRHHAAPDIDDTSMFRTLDPADGSRKR